MNKQTRRFYKKNVSIRFLKGVDFSHQGVKREAVELQFVQFPFGSQPKKKTGNRRYQIRRTRDEEGESFSAFLKIKEKIKTLIKEEGLVD